MSNWTPPQLPTRQLIDAMTSDRPVADNRYDGHMLVANSLALRLAGIIRKTKDPKGWVILRDKAGVPTGALRDTAMKLLLKAVPQMTG